jgi:peptide/nickel transport system substrate-binding protein
VRTRGWITLWVAFVAAVALLTGCSAGPAVNEAAGTRALVAAIGGEPDQYDPHKTTSYFSFQVLENIYDTLVEPDQNLEMKPALATAWKTSPDQLTWTFTLRQGVKFHDGSPLTASDVVYSYRRIIDEKLPNSYRFSSVSDVSAPDPGTVVVKVKQPTPNLLTNIGGFKGMAIVQRQNATGGTIARAPIGTGPFKFSKTNPGDSVELVANKEYWGGAPKIAGVTFKFIAEPTVALTNLRGGQIQWTDNLPPQQVRELGSSKDLVVQSKPSNDYWYLAANEKRKPYDDPRVRQAIAYAINREAITKAAKFGNAIVNQTAIPPNSPWHVPYSPYSRDVGKARQLLSDAGVANVTMDLMVTNEYPETVSVAQVLASELKEIGIMVKIRTLDFAAWLADQKNGNFDAFLLGWLGNLDPDDFYYAQHHSQGSNNFQGYANPQVDQLLDAGRIEIEQAKRKAFYGDAAKKIIDDASYIYLYNPNVVQGWTSKVQGYEERGDKAIRFKSVTLGK